MTDKTINKRALLLTYAFPPLQASESFLSVKAFAKIKSFDIDILTIDPSEIGYDLDYSLEGYVNKNFKKIYKASTPKWISRRMFRFLRYVPGFPDRFRFFNKLLYNKAMEIDVSSYDLIISWSTWHSIHLVAAKIKRKFKSTPWIVHLSDPWAYNPFLTKIWGYKSSQYFLERRVLKASDGINFTTNASRQLVMKKYPKSWMNKTYVTSHSYDLALYEKRHLKPPSDVLIINYLGNFYGPRNPINILNALRNIHAKNSNFLNGIVFRFVGKWIGNENWKSVIYDLPEDLIEVISPVSYIDSLSEMANSDLLLIVDAPFTTSVFFPSKLVDYIGSGKPIFAITPRGSCFDILQKVGGLHASPESLSSIAFGLEEAINKLKEGSLVSPSFKEIQIYSNDYVARQFEILFQQAINS